MKIFTFFLFLISCTLLQAQSLPIDFETSITTSDFIDFDGGAATVIQNPESSGINTSANVAQIVRNGGQVWAGSKIVLATNLDFSNASSISMKIFTSAPIGTVVKMKLEGVGETERDKLTTVSNEWEELIWDFTGAPSNFNTIVFMFDFGNLGDGSANSTFLFDDIAQLSLGAQIDLPVDFEGNTINYTTTDFGGTASSLEVDPTDPTNTVVKVIKTSTAATWAGTTIGTNAGFATDIPLSLSESKMTIRVWSPDAGILVRLKVEDSDDPTHTCETQVVTTVAGAWETLEFDFTNQAPGTELLSVGLSMGWTYNMASIFFNFDTDGATAGEKTYYFDDVTFGGLVLSTFNKEIVDLKVFPNPTRHEWTIQTESNPITRIELMDLNGKMIRQFTTDNHIIHLNCSILNAGIYLAKISTSGGVKAVRLLKE